MIPAFPDIVPFYFLFLFSRIKTIGCIILNFLGLFSLNISFCIQACQDISALSLNKKCRLSFKIGRLVGILSGHTYFQFTFGEDSGPY